jgi:hypothetical protein
MGIIQLFETEDRVMFSSGEQAFIYYSDPWEDSLYFSPDGGKKYFELKLNWLRGLSDNYTISFEDPHHGRTGRLKCNEDTIVLDGVVFNKMDCPSEIEVVPLPTIRVPKYLFRLKDGKFVYVSADKYNYSLESFKLYIGDGTTMHQVEITDRGGHCDGEIIIKTAEGELFSPSGYWMNEVPMWGEEELTKLDPSQFQISETEEGVQISA